TLKGAYGVKLDGIVQQNRDTPTPERKLNVVATVTFDGAGRFTASFVGRINGDSISATIPAPGNPYTVNADCTGTMKLTQVFRGFSDVPASFVIVERGKELFIVVDATTAPTVIQVSGEAERIGGRGFDRD
ncbi:MAG: hypothetical protein N2444_05615, partial [Methylocystis sp.]|nr:hypothetical protein [Methylocystis sp.]